MHPVANKRVVVGAGEKNSFFDEEPEVPGWNTCLSLSPIFFLCRTFLLYILENARRNNGVLCIYDETHTHTQAITHLWCASLYNKHIQASLAAQFCVVYRYVFLFATLMRECNVCIVRVYVPSASDILCFLLERKKLLAFVSFFKGFETIVKSNADASRRRVIGANKFLLSLNYVLKFAGFFFLLLTNLDVIIYFIYLFFCRF